jgi:hypothetical protein
VSYERLVDDPRSTIGALFEWLGLSAGPGLDDAVAEAARFANLDRTAPWIRTDKWRGLLTPEQLEAFETVGGPLLAELGYEPALPVGGHSSPTPRPSPPSPPASRWRRRRLSRPSVLSPEREQYPPKSAFELVNYLLSMVDEGAYESLDGVLGVDLDLVVGDREHRVITGEAAWAALIELLKTEQSSCAEQVVGDVFSVPDARASKAATDTATVVQVHRGLDGALSTRTLIADSDGSRITRIAYFRFPPNQPASDQR